MKNLKEDLNQKARQYCFLLLKFRLRSENEICQRLKRKKFSEEVIRRTADFLKEKGFLNDRAFARSWIDSRLRKPLGLNRIRQELELKGVDREIINEYIRQKKEDYCEEEEAERIARRRFEKTKSVEPETARRRIYAWLLRRGFSAESALQAIKKLCKPTS